MLLILACECMYLHSSVDALTNCVLCSTAVQSVAFCWPQASLWPWPKTRMPPSMFRTSSFLLILWYLTANTGECRRSAFVHIRTTLLWHLPMRAPPCLAVKTYRRGTTMLLWTSHGYCKCKNQLGKLTCRQLSKQFPCPSATFGLPL